MKNITNQICAYEKNFNGGIVTKVEDIRLYKDCVVADVIIDRDGDGLVVTAYKNCKYPMYWFEDVAEIREKKLEAFRKERAKHSEQHGL